MSLITINDILSDTNIASAIEFLKTKANSCGDDGIWLHDLENYWYLNKHALITCIKNNDYTPQLVHEKVIITPSGKHRCISLLSSLDRMLLRAILQVIRIPFEKHFSNYSYAYQTGKGIDDAIACSAEYIESGYEYVIGIDIKDFFENIDHSIILSYIRHLITDDILYELLKKYIDCDIENNCCISRKSCGLLQGSPLSPLLSNLYLTDFDKWMETQGYNFVRFSDDIRIYVHNLQDGYNTLSKIESKLNTYNLSINPDKTGVFSVYSVPYLGHYFEKNGNCIFIKRRKYNQNNIFQNWQKDSVEQINHDYYIINDGILTKKDFTILFANEENNTYIPIETTDSINIYSNVEITPNFLKTLNQHTLNLNFFDSYGTYIGSFYAANQKNRMKCLIKQVEIYQNPKMRLYYAKKIDVASLHNLKCNLRYYMKHSPSDILKNAIDELANGIHLINCAKNIENILLTEARCRQKYYNCINEMLSNDSFYFNNRSRRPPKDEINSMISFGNVYLYQKIAKLIHRTNVDIRISFVHSAMQRYENLNLDIADIFKPIYQNATRIKTKYSL